MVPENLRSEPEIQALWGQRLQQGAVDRWCGDREVLSPLCTLYLKSPLADPVTQVVKLSPADLTAGSHFHFRDSGRVQLKYSLHSFSVGNLSYGKGRVDRTSTPGDDYTCKNLDPLLASFANQSVDLDGVSNVKIRDLLLELLLLDFPDDVHGLYCGGRINWGEPVIQSSLGAGGLHDAPARCNRFLYL